MSDSMANFDKLSSELAMQARMVLTPEVVTNLQEACANVMVLLWCDTCNAPHEIGSSEVPMASVLYRAQGIRGMFPIRVGPELSAARVGVHCFVDHSLLDSPRDISNDGSAATDGNSRLCDIQLKPDRGFVRPLLPLMSPTSPEEVSQNEMNFLNPFLKKACEVWIEEGRNIVANEGEAEHYAYSNAVLRVYATVQVQSGELKQHDPDPNWDAVKKTEVKVGACPQWNYRDILDADDVDWQKLSLEVSVWQNNDELRNDSSTLTDHELVTRVKPNPHPRSKDIFVGKVQVDLSLFSRGWRDINGWYHLLDSQHKTRGQVKVHVKNIMAEETLTDTALANTDDEPLWSTSKCSTNEAREMDAASITEDEFVSPQLSLGNAVLAAYQASEEIHTRLKSLQISEEGISSQNQGAISESLVARDDLQHMSSAEQDSSTPSNTGSDLQESVGDRDTEVEEAMSNLVDGELAVDERDSNDDKRSENHSYTRSGFLAKGIDGLDDDNLGSDEGDSDSDSLEITVDCFKPITLASFGIDELELSPLTEGDTSLDEHMHDTDIEAVDVLHRSFDGGSKVKGVECEDDGFSANDVNDEQSVHDEPLSTQASPSFARKSIEDKAVGSTMESPSVNIGVDVNKLELKEALRTNDAALGSRVSKLKPEVVVDKDANGGQPESDTSNYSGKQTVQYADKAVQVDLLELEIPDMIPSPTQIGRSIDSKLDGDSDIGHSDAEGIDLSCEKNSTADVGCDAMESADMFCSSENNCESESEASEVSSPIDLEMKREADHEVLEAITTGSKVGILGSPNEQTAAHSPFSSAAHTNSEQGCGQGIIQRQKHADAAPSDLKSEKLELVYEMLREMRDSYFAKPLSDPVRDAGYREVSTNESKEVATKEVNDVRCRCPSPDRSKELTPSSLKDLLSVAKGPISPQARNLACDDSVTRVPLGDEIHKGYVDNTKKVLPKLHLVERQMQGKRTRLDDTKSATILRGSLYNAGERKQFHDTQATLVSSSDMWITKQRKCLHSVVKKEEHSSARSLFAHDSETERIARIMQGSMNYWMKEDSSSSCDDEVSANEDTSDDDCYF
ncbi:hypothetical protein PRIC1_002188 [Phytophthora ramorum]